MPQSSRSCNSRSVADMVMGNWTCICRMNLKQNVSHRLGLFYRDSISESLEANSSRKDNGGNLLFNHLTHDHGRSRKVKHRCCTMVHQNLRANSPQENKDWRPRPHSREIQLHHDNASAQSANMKVHFLENTPVELIIHSPCDRDLTSY